ncbi:Purine nucleoside phosphorylase 1 [Stieleria maiorica]|uniref:Purine nucleoside phosphorylase n=1 Tax=Stieleria maiorica TaxID=2795974 RepID=A0A5B9MK93_9BACT|nr:purine-nucleoside phosphorylase [Stieleria maiorica]QEG01639.1 Purine nucleoside phosphorylase 1 [Stieleria maiorica]
MSDIWDDPSPPIDASLSVAVAAIKDRIATTWEFDGDGDGSTITAVVLGSGLGSLADKIESAVMVPFGEIPGFVRSTASGHRGQLVFGTLGGRPLVAMAGRLHRYEGWTHEQVTFPIRVLHAIGATRLIASNAAGGVHPLLSVGDIVVLSDQIDWLHRRRQWARPSQSDADSPGFPVGRRGQIYDPDLAAVALSAAREGGFHAVLGTYLATLGPTYETRAEYRMMRRIGADVVGMSTAGEALTAANLGMSVLALSVVSNVADPDRANVADHAEVLEAGGAAAAKLEGIVRRVISGPNA